MQNRFNIRSKKFLCWLIFIAILVIAAIFFLLTSLNDPDHGFSEDRQKKVDLINISEYIVYTSLDQKQNILEPLPSGCSDTAILGSMWENAHGNKYVIGISTDKREFVVRTKFEDENYYAYASKENEDLDGDVFGCDCNDPYYCFKTDLSSWLENKQ